MKTVLFLCTGNYYRSRLAEIYFNHLAERDNAAWRADSRGLRISPGNVGPISIHTRGWMERQGIPIAEVIRAPIPVLESDFWSAGHIVAVKETEHRPMMESKFPHWTDKVEFWHVHDIDFAEPLVAIPELVGKVEELYVRLKKQA